MNLGYLKLPEGKPASVPALRHSHGEPVVDQLTQPVAVIASTLMGTHSALPSAQIALAWAGVRYRPHPCPVCIHRNLLRTCPCRYWHARGIAEWV